MEHHHLQTVPEVQAINNEKLNDPSSMSPPSPIITRRTRRDSLSERAARGVLQEGKVKYFCRQRGHGFIVPNTGGGDDDVFVHISDIEGEFVPHEGDIVCYKLCPIPPKFERMQAVHVKILNLAPGEKHERWDQPMPSPKPKHEESNTLPSPKPKPEDSNTHGETESAGVPKNSGDQAPKE